MKRKAKKAEKLAKIENKITRHHDTGAVGVEVDPRGQVVSVWFEDRALPFHWTYVDSTRTEEMREMYKTTNLGIIHSIRLDRTDVSDD